MKHYHLIEYMNIIHDKDKTDNINDQYSTRRSDKWNADFDFTFRPRYL